MPKFAANLTMLYNELDFLDRFDAAAAAGFRGVEFLFPYAFPAAEIGERLARNRLALVLHNLPAGNWEAGERGIACHPDRVGEFQDGVGKAIEYAKALGVPQLNCLAGIVPQGVTRDAARATFVANLQFAAAKLERRGHAAPDRADQHLRHPGILPVGHAAGARHHRRDRRRQPLPAIRHLSHAADGRRAREHDQDEPARASVTSSSPTIPAGTSREPARSTTAYLFRAIDALGYDGWIGCEYKPATHHGRRAAWIAPYR